MKITYKGKELEVQEPIKIEELLKKEIGKRNKRWVRKRHHY